MGKLNNNSSEMYNSYLLGVSDMKAIKENILEIESDIILIAYKRNEDEFKSRESHISSKLKDNHYLDKYVDTNIKWATDADEHGKGFSVVAD